MRYIRWERERERERYRERERERRKWRHHCRANIGDEFTLSLCQKFAQLAMSLHFPLPKTRTFRFSLHTSRRSLHGEVTIVALKFAMSSHFPLPKFFSPSLFPLFQMARAARRVIENPRQTIKSCPVLYCSSHRKTESNQYQKLLEIEKEIVREVARGDKSYLRKSTDRKAQIRRAFRSVQRTDLCFAICRFSQVRFITPSHLTHNLFFYFQ